MKKLFFLIFVLTILLPSTADAHDFEVDGIYYLRNGNDAIVTFRGTGYSLYNEYSGSVTIPPSVTYDGATYSVTSIGDAAFRECSDLISVTIPNSVTDIAHHAFYGCSGLTSLNIPNSITSIEQGAFSGCSGLTSLNIPNSITSIGQGAFHGCSGLTSITIPNSITTIGDEAFHDCI